MGAEFQSILLVMGWVIAAVAVTKLMMGGHSAAPSPTGGAGGVSSNSAADGGIPDDHVAAIAAAVYAMLGSGRVVRIEDAGRGAQWVAAGRMTHQTSHATHRTTMQSA